MLGAGGIVRHRGCDENGELVTIQRAKWKRADFDGMDLGGTTRLDLDTIFRVESYRRPRVA